MPINRRGDYHVPHECGACEGTGLCHNEFHNPFSGMVSAGIHVLTGDDELVVSVCPACGQEEESPGNCSVCGGSGVQDDED